jgi:hypothetical protein
MMARNPEQWEVLRTVLSLGGGWEEDTFVAPYVSGAWPKEHNDVEKVAIVGSRVRVRAEPRSDADVLAFLTECIVATVETREYNEDWVSIDLGEKRVGYVSARHARSQRGYRAGFELKEGRWRMTFFVAGD